MHVRSRRLICALILLTSFCAFAFPVAGLADGAEKTELEDRIRYFATSDKELPVWRGPDKARGVSYRIDPHTPIYIIEIGTEWTKVFTDDSVGYVLSDGLKDIKEHQEGVPDEVTEGKDAQQLLAEYQDSFDSSVPPVVSQVRVKGVAGPYIPTLPRANDASFKGALLLGDSQSSGLLHNKLIPALEIKPVIGLCIRDIWRNKKVIAERGQGKMRVTEYLLYKSPKTVYIWLAQNDIKDYPADKVLQKYDLGLNRLIEAMPNTLFYLFEMVPLHRYKEGVRETLTTKNIRAFNEGLYALAQRHNVFVMRINDILSDQNGEMPSILVSSDNFHLSTLGQKLVAEYILTHTLEVEP